MHVPEVTHSSIDLLGCRLQTQGSLCWEYVFQLVSCSEQGVPGLPNTTTNITACSYPTPVDYSYGVSHCSKHKLDTAAYEQKLLFDMSHGSQGIH